MRSPKSFRRQQGGYTLLEIQIGLLVLSIVYMLVELPAMVRGVERTFATAVGQYVMQIGAAVDSYQRSNWSRLNSATPAVTGFANPLQPTVAELIGARFLPSSFPLNAPRAMPVKARIDRSGCPGASCALVSYAYVDAPFTVGRTGQTPRYDLAQVAVDAMGGRGGMSNARDDSVIAGPAFNVPNPVTGKPGAVVMFAAYLDSAVYNQFVTIRDTRDPDLQGNLSVAKDLAIAGNSNVAGNASVQGTLGVTGALTAGSATLGATTVNGTATVNGSVGATGDVTGRGSVGASNGACLRTVMTSSGVIAIRDPGCTDAITLDGTGRTVSLTNAGGAQTVAINGGAGTVRAQRVGVSEAATAGTSCAAASPGDIVLDASGHGSLLVCQAGVWKAPSLTTASVGSACPVDGRLAQDPNEVALICRSGSYASLNDRIGNKVLMSRYIVTDNSVVMKPSCGVGGYGAIQISAQETGADYGGAPPRNRFTAWSADTGSSWVAYIRLSDESGAAYSTSFSGTPYQFQALASVYCDYPN